LYHHCCYGIITTLRPGLWCVLFFVHARHDTLLPHRQQHRRLRRHERLHRHDRRGLFRFRGLYSHLLLHVESFLRAAKDLPPPGYRVGRRGDHGLGKAPDGVGYRLLKEAIKIWEFPCLRLHDGRLFLRLGLCLVVIRARTF
ncbi:HCMVUL41, partial [Human betaherpesvirus 5]